MQGSSFFFFWGTVYVILTVIKLYRPDWPETHSSEMKGVHQHTQQGSSFFFFFLT